MLISGWGGCVHVEERVEPTNSAEQSLVLQQKGALHREVWKTVADFYYDPEYGGVDWVKVGRETNELLPSAQDVEGVYDVLKTMVGALDDRHTYVLSPRDYAESQKNAFVGVGLTTGEHRTMKDVDIVLRVAPDSSADEAGVEPGWLLLNGSQVLDCSVSLGETQVFRFLDQNEQVREIRLEARMLPKTADQREVRIVESNILYLRFDYFEKGIAEWFDQQLKDHPEVEGLVLDLRWNPGGLKSELDLMFQEILPENSRIGVVVSRKHQLQHEFTPSIYQKPAVDIPIAVLVSPYSASCSEILAAVMQHHQRGIIIGIGHTAGEVLFSPGWQLPAGGMLKIAARDYRTPSGKRLQGVGVEPDIVTQSRTLFEFRRGNDPTLDAGLQALKAMD